MPLVASPLVSSAFESLDITYCLADSPRKKLGDHNLKPLPFNRRAKYEIFISRMPGIKRLEVNNSKKMKLRTYQKLIILKQRKSEAKLENI